MIPAEALLKHFALPAAAMIGSGLVKHLIETVEAEAAKTVFDWMKRQFHSVYVHHVSPDRHFTFLTHHLKHVEKNVDTPKTKLDIAFNRASTAQERLYV